MKNELILLKNLNHLLNLNFQTIGTVESQATSLNQ